MGEGSRKFQPEAEIIEILSIQVAPNMIKYFDTSTITVAIILKYRYLLLLGQTDSGTKLLWVCYLYIRSKGEGNGQI